MKLLISDASKVLVIWLDENIIPKLSTLQIKEPYSKYKPFLEYGAPIFIAYNFPNLDEQIQKSLRLFTMNSDYIELERFEQAVLKMMENEGGSGIQITKFYPILDTICPYRFDKEDLKQIMEIAKRYAQNDENKRESGMLKSSIDGQVL